MIIHNTTIRLTSLKYRNVSPPIFLRSKAGISLEASVLPALGSAVLWQRARCLVQVTTGSRVELGEKSELIPKI